MANNILVDWMNQRKANRAFDPAMNVQNRIANTNTASNVKATPNLQRPTINHTGINLQKAQQPVQTKLNSLNNQTLPNMNQGPMMNGQPMTQDSLKSRFIGLQGNNNLPSTDLGGNIIQSNVDKKKKEKERQQKEAIEKLKNRPVLNIPSKKNEIEQFNKKQSDTYRTNENVIKDFHYDVQKFGGQMTKEQISQLYPEFQGKEDIALMLQADILPLVQNNEFADMKKLSEIYPELLPKQKKVGDQILKDQEKQANEIREWSKKAEKTLGRYNVLSKNGEKYLQDAWQVGDFIKEIRKSYNLPGNPSDIDILNFGKENIPELKAILDDMEMLKSNFNLTERDRDIILENGFDIGEWLYQAGADIKDFTQNNQLKDYLDKNSSTRGRQLNNLGINSGIADIPQTALDVVDIPVNMVGDLASGLGKLGIASERIATQQNRNEDLTTDYNGIVKDVIRGGGGALDVGFNTVMAIPTALFHLAEETEGGKEIIDSTIGEATNGINDILNGNTLEKAGLSKENNPLAQWYNNLDKETQADLTNEVTVAIFHKGGKVVKDLKERGELGVEAVNNAFMKAWKDPKRGKAIESFKENGIMDENGNVTPGNRKAVATAVAKEFTKTFGENLKTNFSKYNTVLRERRGKTTVKDNRTFKEKTESKINQAKQTVNEGINKVKQGVNSVKEGVQNVTVGGVVKGVSEKVGEGVKATSDLYKKGKNAVTQGKNKVTNAVKENVVEPFKKGYEGVKETVNETVKENITDPYNKGRGKTTVSTSQGVQGETEVGIKEVSNQGSSISGEKTGAEGEIKLTNDTQKVAESKTSLSDKVWESVSGIDDATRERMESNPYSAEENKNLIDTMEKDSSFDFNEYQTNRYQNVLDTIVDKLEQKENTRKNEIGPLYQKLEETNAPIDTANIKSKSNTFRDRLAENDGIISSSEQTKINKLLDAIDSLGDGTTDIWQVRRMADQRAKRDSESTSDGIRLIREIRDSIDDEIKTQRPEMKEVDTEYRRIKDEISDLKGNLINKKSGKLRDNAVSTVKNLLNPSNKLFLDRLEKEIPGITKQLQAIRDSKFVYNAYQTGNGSRFISGIMRGTLGNVGKLAGLGLGGLGGLLIGSLVDKAVDSALVNLTRKALKETVTKMTPKAQAELDSIMKKVQEGKDLSAKEKAKLKDIENKIVENAKNAKKTKSEQDAWNSFLDKVKQDAKSNKLPYMGEQVGVRTLITNGKTIITDAKGNSKVKGQISEIDKRKPKEESESKPKNKVTSKKSAVTEKKTEVKEEKKAEQPKAKKENKKLTIEERNAEFEKSVDENKLNEIREYAKENGKLNIVPIGIRKTLQLKNHGVMLSKAEIEILEKEGLLKGAEQPKEEKQLETRVEKQEPKTQETTGEKNAVTAKSVDKKENTNIIGKNNSLTTKNNNDGQKLGANEQRVGQSNGGTRGELRDEISNMQSVESNETGLQRSSDTNGNGKLNTSREQADISGNGLTAGPESTRLTVGQQRKINEDSRNILEKHNFSTSRSDYTPEELDTLFKYEGNGGLAKAGDENVKGTRYEFYTPKNAVSALQRGIQKYSDSPINSVEDPTAGKGNMLDGYGENIDKYMYEINPVSGTIAKLRFPEAKVGIGEKNGDFQRRYLNYQGQKAYDTPRDGGHNVDAILLNPPFGKRITIKDEPQIKSLEDYFTKRSIEHDLKDGGMVGLLMPSRWLKSGDSYTKQRLAENTEFVDAYRLPAGVFSYTDVGTDLIILKKKKGANNNLTKVVFYDDNYFIANPDKVLGVEKQRTGKHGMETYIDGDPKVIDTLWQDTDIVPSKMNAITDTTKKTAVTAKSTPVENKPKNLVTNPPKEDAKFTPTEKTTTTEKPKAEKKTTTRKSKNAKQTISKGDKTDIGTYTVNGNEKAYTYQDATDADGFIDRSKLSISPKEVAEGVDLLNYIDGKIQTDYLYFSGDIYAKLKQLEKDKPQMSDAQYKKQKEGLQAILPDEVKTRDVVWSPTDKMLLEVKTDKLETYRDRDLGQEVNRPLSIREAFIERIRNLPGTQFNGTGTSKGNIADFVNRKKWSSERLSKRYDETDEEFAIRKKFKKAEEEQKKQATKERAWNFFNDFINDQLSPEIQKKITDSYNQRLRAVVKPDYKSMPLSVKNMSATFHGKPLKIDPVQIEGINAMLSKGTMLIAHGVGYGKTLEGVVATITSLQKGWTKKPLFIVPKGTRVDWINTIQDLFPNQEIVDLGGLTVADIKRLRQDLGNDVKNWIKEGQVGIVTHNGFNNKINFKSETQESIMGDLRDVMKSKDSTAREEDTLDENVQNIAETMGKSKDTKKLKGIKAKLSEKYGDELLEELDNDIQNMSETEFVENFVTKADGKYPEKEMREDAHKMYETKPIYIEDLGIDHITVDEAHNYKNIFTSAKAQKSQGGKEEVNPYGKISGSSSARGRKMFATSQYILKNNNGRGVFSLTATPFNNQPIEVYNMLSLHAYNRLVEKGIRNINSFFDLFANFRTEFIYNSLKEGGGEYGEVMKDFNNLPEMQRLIGEYIDYVGDNPNLVRPEKRMRKVILKPSQKQVDIQNQLQKEEKRRAGGGESVLPLYTDMRLNIISPYLTSYGKTELGVPTWKEFIEDSPKLKFAVETIKALRNEGHNDGVFIYMPLGVEFHELLKEAIEKTVGPDKVKVGIINGETTGTETVDGEKVERRIAIADRFRKGELNVLIGGSNTSEGINLQDNGYITINTLIGWNPTEITQLNGRIHRQGNLRDHVIELLPLLTNGGDVMMMQKYDEKANRINNIFESQGRTFNLEELDPEEEKMALNTDPVRKAELSIDIDKKRLNRDIQKLSGQNGTLQEIISRMPKEEDIRESEEKIQKKQGELEQIKEGLKALDKDSSAYRSLEYEKESVERNIKNEKEYLKKLDKNRERAESRMQQYSIETIDAVKEKIKENEAILDDLNEQVKSIDAEKEQRIAQFTKEYEEWESSMKTPEEYIEDLKEDFRSKKIFGDREELKQYLNEKKENKNKATSNGKNKITNG